MSARRLAILIAAAAILVFPGCASRRQPDKPEPPTQTRDLGQGAGGEKLGRPATDQPRDTQEKKP